MSTCKGVIVLPSLIFCLDRLIYFTLYLFAVRIQTRRVALNSFEEWLGAESTPLTLAEAAAQMRLLTSTLDAFPLIDLCSLGGCSEPWAAALLPSLLSFSSKLSASFQIKAPPAAFSAPIPSYDLCLRAAHTTIALSKQQSSGAANFHYCVSFNCPPNVPFFPAAYHSSSPSPPLLTVGLETGDLLFMAFHGLNDEYSRASEILEDVLRQALQPVETILLSACEEAGLAYGGIDASMNPGLSMQESVGAGMENLAPHLFGAAGTLAAACAITTAVKGLKNHIRLTGYSGLMLPVMEDLILSRRAGINKTASLNQLYQVFVLSILISGSHRCLC